MNLATTPIYGAGGILYDSTPDELRPILALSDAERARQQEVITARRFHEGRHAVQLTARLKEFLGDDCGPAAVRLNMVQKINRAIATRLRIETFGCDAKDDADNARQIEFADSVWTRSRMKSKRSELHIAAIRDGEAFVIIDWDAENERSRWTPHETYTDTGVSIDGESGTGEGVRMFYPNDDTSQPPLYAVKRWIEQVTNGREIVAEPRLNIYYPEKTVKYALRNNHWVSLGSEPWTRAGVDDTEGQGDPLGIPVVHIKTPTMLPAAREAILLQKGLNKTYIDMLAASDLSAWRLLVAFGWEPDDDAIKPGSIIGTTSESASIESIEGSDPAGMIALIDKGIALMADVEDVPLSLLQRSAQRAAEGTLQEEKESFRALVGDHADTMELAYEDGMKIARRLHNTFGTGEQLDETPEFVVVWQEVWTRSTDEIAGEAAARIASGYTVDEVQRQVWGESEEVIKRMKDDKKRDLIGDGFHDDDDEPDEVDSQGDNGDTE